MYKTVRLGMILCVVVLYVHAQPDGAAIYKTQCSVCHGNSAQTRAPDADALKTRTPEAALASLTSGSMAAQGAPLSDAEKRAVAEFVTGKKLGATGSVANAGKCANPNAPLADPASMAMWNGWGPGVESSHYADPRTAGITAAQVPQLKLKWAFGFPNGTAAYAEPSVVAGRVWVGSDKGNFYSLDAKTGCTYWSFNASASVRTAPTVAAFKSGPVKYGVFFGDLQANVYALNAQTGEVIWKIKVDDHAYARITGAPVLNGDRLYVPVSSVEEVPGARAAYECCKFRGSVVAMDTATGKVIWKSYTIPDEPKPTKINSAGKQLWGPAGASVWAAATLDLKKHAVLVGTGNAYTEPAAPTSDSVIAFDMEFGKMLWHSQALPKDSFVIGCAAGNENCPKEVGPDHDFGTAPILRTLPGGKRIIVVGQKSGVLWGLDPDNEGKVLWQYRAGKGGALGGIEWGVAADETQAYAPVCDRLPPATPGGLHAVKIATGERVWYAPPPELHCTAGAPGCGQAQSAAISVMPGAVFSGSVDGHLRAYSTKDGSIIWDFDTMRDFDTVNGVKAAGGSIDAAGPAIAGGMVFSNSGYGSWGGKAGNVLLAFAP